MSSIIMPPLVPSPHGIQLRVTPTQAHGAAAKRGVFTDLQIVRHRQAAILSSTQCMLTLTDQRSVPPHTAGALPGYSAAHGGVLPR
jgi:hypothetical protein